MRRLLVLCCAVLGASVGVAGPAGASGPDLSPVASVRASASSHSVTLSWTNPADRRVTGVEIRGTRRPGVLPAGPHSNGHVARVSRAHHSYIVHGLAADTRYGLSLFATDGHGHYSRRVALFVITAPAPVGGVQTFEHGTGTRVTWSNSRGTARVVLRYARGSVAPISTSSGHGVAVHHGRATSATLPSLARNTRYSVSVFALDAAGHVSTPAVTRFTTAPRPQSDAVVTGRVVDSSGDPLVGADVGALSLDSFSVTQTTTGGDGRFSLAVSGAEAELAVGGNDIRGGTSDASGYQELTLVRTLHRGTTTAVGDLVLVAGAAVSIRAVDSAGSPVPGVAVAVDPVQPYASGDSGGGVFYGDAFLTTGQDGTAVVRGLSPRDAVRACVVSESTYAGACARDTIVPVVDTVTPAGDLAAETQEPAVSITGQLRGGGHPLPGVAVVASSAAAGSFAQSVTAADGTFRLDGLAAGSYTVCAADYSGPLGGGTGYQSTCRAGVTAPGTDVRLTESAAAGISGTVVGPGGHAVTGASVELVTSGPNSGDSEQVAVTDAAGHFRAVGLPAQPFALCVDPTTGAQTGTGLLGGCYRHAATIDLTREAVRTGLDVTLGVAGAISGVVRDSRGAPLPDIDVADVSDEDIDSSDAVTDAHGRYALRGLAPGRHSLCLQTLDPDDDLSVIGCSSDSAAATVTTRTGSTTRADLVQHDDAALTVAVRDADGTPVAAADVTVLTACNDADGYECGTVEPFAASTRVDEVTDKMTYTDGGAGFVGLAPGHYALCAFAYYATTATGGSPTGYADTCSGHTFSLTVPAASTTSVTIVLTAGGAYTGRVVDAAGSPLAGVHVHAANSGATDYPGAPGSSEGVRIGGDPAGIGVPGTDELTASDGTYTILGVRPGGGIVCTDAAGVDTDDGGYVDSCSGGTPVAVQPGATTSLPDLVLARGGAISGTVRDSAGSDVEIVVFAGRSVEHQVAVVGLEQAGRWTVAQLPAGSYTVCATDDESGAGQCWKGVAWDADNDEPPLGKATLVPVTVGAVTRGVDTVLAR